MRDAAATPATLQLLLLCLAVLYRYRLLPLLLLSLLLLLLSLRGSGATCTPLRSQWLDQYRGLQDCPFVCIDTTPCL
jgi:hypothetical protein